MFKLSLLLITYANLALNALFVCFLWEQEKGGPKLVYDHQLALDAEAQILYVQGGRVVDGDWNTPKYSGLFGYDLRTGKWNALQ